MPQPSMPWGSILTAYRPYVHGDMNDPVSIDIRLWPGAQPGEYVLFFDGIEIPLQLAVNGLNTPYGLNVDISGVADADPRPIDITHPLVEVLDNDGDPTIVRLPELLTQVDVTVSDQGGFGQADSYSVLVISEIGLENLPDNCRSLSQNTT